MKQYLVEVTFYSNPDELIQGLISAKSYVDALEQCIKVLLLADDMLFIDVVDTAPFTNDDLYLTDMNDEPVFNINKELNISLQYYQILTKKIKPSNEYFDKMIKHFEGIEKYERCSKLLDIKNRK